MIAEAVPDPELVVVTVGDLGIVRDIRTDAAGVEIDVTPTYSACPATRSRFIGPLPFTTRQNSSQSMGPKS